MNAKTTQPANPQSRKVLRETEVMERTGLCRTTVRKLRQQGDLQVVRFGRAVRYTEDSVERLLQCGADFEPAMPTGVAIVD